MDQVVDGGSSGTAHRREWVPVLLAKGTSFAETVDVSREGRHAVNEARVNQVTDSTGRQVA